VSVPPTAPGQRLVHMTEAADAISRSGRLGLSSDIYAGPASNANKSGWALTRRTGLSPRGNYEPVWIPEAAEAAITKPLPVGPFTAWQRATGQRYTARGVIDLSTEEFTRTGVNGTQALWYTIDVGITGTALGAGALYRYSSGREEPWARIGYTRPT